MVPVVVGGQPPSWNWWVDNGKVDFSTWTNMGSCNPASHCIIFFYKSHAHPSWVKMSALLEPRKSLKGPSLHNFWIASILVKSKLFRTAATSKAMRHVYAWCLTNEGFPKPTRNWLLFWRTPRKLLPFWITQNHKQMDSRVHSSFLRFMSPHHLFETASVACFFGSSNHGWLVVWDHKGFGLVKNSWKKSV